MAHQPTKCCCCVPLRPGLLAWAYIKLVLVLTFIGWYLFITRYWLRLYFYHNISFSTTFVIEQLAPIPVTLVFLLFTIIFIIGVHRENSKLLLTFLVYSIFEAIFGVVLVGWQLYNFVDAISYYKNHPESYNFEKVLHDFMFDPTVYQRFIGLPVLLILLPIYLIVLIKSELKRLKISRGGTRVVFDQPIAIEQDKRHNLSYIH